MPAVQGVVNRALPTPIADGQSATIRLGRYAEEFVIPLGTGLQGLAEEGSLFVATNPTISTGIASTIQTSFAATNGLITLRNTDSAGGRNIIPIGIRIIPTVVPASATRVEAAITIDSITRYSSGGSAITNIVNTNMDSARTTIAALHFGALTLASASGNVRTVSRFQLNAVIPVQFEEYYISFGTFGGDSVTLGGTTATRRTVTVPPVVLGPGNNHTMCVHVWYPGNATTAQSSEFEILWIER